MGAPFPTSLTILVPGFPHDVSVQIPALCLLPVNFPCFVGLVSCTEPFLPGLVIHGSSPVLERGPKMPAEALCR